MNSKERFSIQEEGRGRILTSLDMDEFREWNRQKGASLKDKRISEEEAVDRFVEDGQYIGIELYGTVRCPMSLVRALVRSGKKNFGIAGQGVHEMDLLFTADMLRRIDWTYIGQEVNGLSQSARRRVEEGSIEEIVEWSNAALTWRFKAAAMGIPFLPARSMIGTDTFKYSASMLVNCPFTGQPLVLIPALIMDVCFIHVNRADKYGNCQIDGISGMAFEMARASKRVIISAEEIVDEAVIRRNPERTVIPFYLVDGVVHAPYGSWPGEMTGLYERDTEHYDLVLVKHKTATGAQDYLKEWCLDLPDHRALIKKAGMERIDALRVGGRA